MQWKELVQQCSALTPQQALVLPAHRKINSQQHAVKCDETKQNHMSRSTWNGLCNVDFVVPAVGRAGWLVICLVMQTLSLGR